MGLKDTARKDSEGTKDHSLDSGTWKIIGTGAESSVIFHLPTGI